MLCSRCNTEVFAEDHGNEFACLIALRYALNVFVYGLNPDECRVLERMAERLRKGKKTYGPWACDKDKDYKKEVFNEVLDASLYALMALMTTKPST